MVAVAPQPTGKPGPLRPQLWQVKGLRMFAAGKARGQDWTESDIDDMARNARNYGHLVRPTVVIGHEEVQPLADGMPATVEQNTGQPAFGRVVNLRKEKAPDGTFLTGDLRDVPYWLAKAIAGKSYIDRSVELYDEPPDGLKSAKGPVVRRLALLGGELPQIKNLGQMPDPEPQAFSELVIAAPRRALRAVGDERRRDHKGRFFRVMRFSEAPVKTCKKYSALSDKTKGTFKRFADSPESPAVPDGVSRQDMLDTLADYGVDTSAEGIANLPDAGLAEIVRVLSSTARADEPAPPQSQMADDPAATTATPPLPAVPTPTADMSAGAGQGGAQPTSVTVKFNEETQKAIDAAVAKAIAGVGGKLATIEKTADDRLADEKKAGIQSFVERMVKEGKVLAAARPSLIEQGMLQDAAKVHKFSDGVSQTPLDRWKKTIEDGPVILSFAERMKVGAGDTAGTGDPAAVEVAKVQKFCERPEVASGFAKIGINAAKKVEEFKALQKKDPTYTAERFIGQPV
jgi:hypothetical protein